MCNLYSGWMSMCNTNLLARTYGIPGTSSLPLLPSRALLDNAGLGGGTGHMLSSRCPIGDPATAVCPVWTCVPWTLLEMAYRLVWKNAQPPASDHSSQIRDVTVRMCHVPLHFPVLSVENETFPLQENVSSDSTLLPRHSRIVKS
jgi:hypothetical protein